MSQTPTTKQFGPRRRLGFFFVFRIRPGFFVGFVPGRFGAFSSDPNCQYDDDMAIEQISEQEYMVLVRMGVTEVQVMM